MWRSHSPPYFNKTRILRVFLCLQSNFVKGLTSYAVLLIIQAIKFGGNIGGNSIR